LQLDVFGDGSLRADLERQAERLGVAATFHGQVPDVGERLLDVDLFALPTRGDNLPIAVLEAMAAALPVVATRTGGLPELVDDGQTGTLVEPDDPTDLAAAVARLARDEEMRVRLGRAGAARVRQHFDARNVARQMVALYERLLDSRR
jgi:glycosyltransferase involved in cell wall biosynthesis